MDKEFDKITFWESDDYDSHDFDPYEEEMNQSGLVICGNRDKVDMGDPDLIDLVKQYHDVELVLAGLKKATGKTYEKRTIRGYTQGDWNTLFYPEGTSEELLDTIEDMYMGNYGVYFTEDETVEPNYVYVLNHQLDRNTDAKDIIAQETGLPASKIEVKRISGYSQDPIYEEKEDEDVAAEDIEEEAKWEQVNELIGGRGEFLGKVDEYKDIPVYKYRAEGGREILYFFVGPSVSNDRFEFDAEDEDAAIGCIDEYKAGGIDAADRFWQNLYESKDEKLTESKKESPKKYIHDLCDELDWGEPLFTDPAAGGYRLRYRRDPEIYHEMGSPRMTEERANELLAELKDAANKLGIKLVKAVVKRGRDVWEGDTAWLPRFAPTYEEYKRLNGEMMSDAETRGLTKERDGFIVFDWDKIDSDPEAAEEFKKLKKEYTKNYYEIYAVVPRYSVEDKKVEEKLMKESALDRFKKMDDMVDEAVELPETVYSVSYVRNEGPYQAIMVKASSSEEAERKVADRFKDAEIIGSSIEYDVDEMKKRGKPLLEEIEDDISMREWYMRTFPNDDLGHEIDPDVTFNDLQNALDEKKDVYELIGVGDSIVRERLFDKLADLTGVAYDDVFEKWINSEDINSQFLTSIKDKLERGEG